MKKTKLSLWLILTVFYFIGNGQTTGFNNQSTLFVDIKFVRSTYDNQWMISGNRAPSDHGYPFLEIINSFTNDIEFNSENQEIPAIEKLIIDGDIGHVLFFDEKPNIARFIIKEDAEIEVTSWGQFLFGSGIEILNIKPYYDGKVIAVGRREVVGEDYAFLKIFDDTFQVEYENFSSKGYFDDVIVLPDSSFFLTGSFGDDIMYGVRKYNDNYTFIKDTLAGMVLGQVFPSGNGYFTLKEQVLTRFDDTFQVEDSIDLDDYGMVIDVEVDQNNAFVLMQNEGAAPKILKLNNLLQEEGLFTFEDEFFITQDMHLSEEEIGVGGYLIQNVPINDTSYQHSPTSGYFTTLSKTGEQINEEIDLELVNVEVVDHEKNFNCGPSDLADAYSLKVKNLKVTIVNHGMSSIEKLSLFAEVEGVGNCVLSSFGSKFYHQEEKLELLHLSPGDTLRGRIALSDSFQRMKDTTLINLCIWVSSIDNQRDKKYHDNYFCDKIELQDGYFERPIAQINEASVSPNPINNRIAVSLKRPPIGVTSIKFYDFLGRPLEQTYLIAPRAQYKEFDVSQIPSGFYFMHISNDLINEGIQVYVN